MTTARSSIPEYPDNTISFPKLECNSNNQENNNYNNNNYHARVRACAREMLMIDEAYEDVLGRKMPRFVENEIQGMIADGVDPRMIRDVLEYTACAPRPSWAYARAVIYRSHEKGISTAGAFAASLAGHGRDGDRLPY